MANLLVIVETQRNGAPRPVCMEALGRAREIATHLGAAVYAAVLLGRPPTEELLTALSNGGADRILLAEQTGFDGCLDLADFQSHGAALRALVERVVPSLVLFGAGPGAWELAPRLAAALGAVFLSDIELRLEEGAGTSPGRLSLGDGEGSALDGDAEVAAVGIVAPARYLVATGGDESEVEMVRLPGGDADPVLAPAQRFTRPEQSIALVGMVDDAALWQRALGAARIAHDGPAAQCARLAVSAGDPMATQVPLRVALGASVRGAQLIFDGAPQLLAEAISSALSGQVER